jgi:hypothetical protein
MFEPAEIRKLNYCRLYLNAVTLADLMTTAEDRLDNSKLNGQISLMSSRNSWMAINQDNPSPSEWRLWRKTNELWSSPGGNMIVPLGPWLGPARDSRIKAFAYQIARQQIEVRTQDGYILCDECGGNTYRPSEHAHTPSKFPPNAIPVEVEVVDGDNECWEVTLWTQVRRLVTHSRNATNTFAEYVQTLDAWEVDILRHTQVYADPMLISLELTFHFVAGSDGSEKYGTNGAFGWMVSNLDGERLASGMGPARGCRMDSYRAESCGMLSVLRFLIRLADYTQRDASEWCGMVVTDSQSLLDRLFGHKAKSADECYGNDVLDLDVLVPEWDRFDQDKIRFIAHAMRQLEIRERTASKDAHQDRQNNYEALPLVAQLNIDADDLAGKYQSTHGRPHQFVLMTPHAAAHLYYPEGTITANYVSDLRFRSTEPALRSYIQVKNNWTDAVMETINWLAHGKALRSMMNTRIHFIKLVHECPPTTGQQNWRDNGNRTCPRCATTKEDRDHIIRCEARTRAEWRANFRKSTREFHTKHDTAPDLQQLWEVAMDQWLNAPEGDIVFNSTLFPDAARPLVEQQNRIGWRQVLNGRFSSEWRRLQDQHYLLVRRRTHEGKKDKQTGQWWQRSFILFIWSQWLTLWKLRNNELHGANEATKQTSAQRIIHSELRNLYDRRESMEDSVQTLLMSSEAEHRQRPIWMTRNWLEANTKLFRDSMRKTRQKAIAGVRTIQSYFPPVR